MEEASLEALTGLLGHPQAGASRSAVRALCLLGSQRSHELDGAHRREAANRHAAVVKALWACCASEDAATRALAVHGLAEAGVRGADAALAVVAMLEDGSTNVRRRAGEALARIVPRNDRA